MSGLGHYAEALGIVAETGRLRMPFAGDVEGRPGFLHGGAIAGLLEVAGLAAARAAGAGEARLVTITVDYLRAGRPVDTFAQGKVIRIGRRVAHVEASAWQGDPATPIGTARISLVLGSAGG